MEILEFFPSMVMLDGYSDLLAKSYRNGVEISDLICCDDVVCWFTDESSTKKTAGGKGT